MDKQRARQLYELFNRLSKLDVNTLSEQQLQYRSSMIAKLKEEVKAIKEFAPDDGSGDGGEEETLHKYARMWYNGDLATQQQVEQVLARMGWEIGEIESEEGGAFVVQSGDEHGDSYIGFAVADLTEGWKSALGSAALAGAMALGGGGHAQAADLSNFNTQYLQQVASGEHPRPMVSVDDAKAELQARANGKQQTTSPARIDSPSGPQGFSKEYLQKAADPNRFGRYLISVEKAQELLKQMGESVTEGSQRVDSLVTDALRIMKGSEVSDAVLALKRVLGDRAYNERRGFYSFYVKQIHDMYGQQGVEEADMSRRGFLGALAGAGLAAAGLGAAGNAMAGPNDPGFVKKVQDKHFEMVEKNPRYANEHQALQLPFARGMSGNSAEMNKQWAIKTAQLLQKYGVKVNEGVAEAKKPSPKLTAVNIKKTDPVSEEINNEAYERLQKVFAFKNYEG